MPKSAWQDWGQVAETFVAERPVRDPDLTVEVLVLVLRFVGSWGDLVAGGSWVLLAATEVNGKYVPGFRDARTHQLLDRFTSWLHGRGDIDDWQRDVMHSEIDAMRRAHGRPEKRSGHVTELRLERRYSDKLIAAFAATLEDAVLRSQAPAAVRLLITNVEVQLGCPSESPMGSLDADTMIRDVLAVDGGETAADAALFTLGSLFYRWLGTTSRLEPARAFSIASRFAAAAVGMARAPLRGTKAPEMMLEGYWRDGS